MANAHVVLKKLWYTPEEVGELVGCSRQTVVKWARLGRIEATRTPGGHWRIPAGAIKRSDGHVERFAAGRPSGV